ncbi:VOC family protein [Ilumatobacter nonamiensis]|uniref:VOC family protein n=1 Tax=Ilumatobacter nonamiensis TaxID=467093 RepID=UPI000347EDD9|nr:VOC family protein [Ilumatobacter nonamiensis]
MTPRLDMIGIVAQDLAASLAFYRQLGLDIPESADNEPHVEVTLPNGLRLAWDPVSTITSFDDSWTAPSGSPRVALAFLCDSATDVDAVHSELVAAGHHSHLAPFDAPWGQRYATVHDPDGNGVDLFAPLETVPSGV